MTKDELKTLIQFYLDKWTPRLRLRDWDWMIDTEHDDEDSGGCVAQKSWKMLGRISARQDLPEWYRRAFPASAKETDAQLVERFVVHELAHAISGAERFEFKRLFDWWFGLDGHAEANADIRRRFTELEEAIASRTARILIEADRGGWNVNQPGLWSTLNPCM